MTPSITGNTSPSQGDLPVAASVRRIGGDIDVQFLKQEPEAVEFNVTGCRYADFFRQLGEPELGGLLLCDGGFHVADIGSPEVQLTRTQTIMQGASYCDFRYRMRSWTVPVSWARVYAASRCGT